MTPEQRAAALAELGQPVEATGGPSPEWAALLTAGKAGGDTGASAICEAYSLGLRRGVERMSDELGVISIALDVAQAALHRIHDRPDMPPSIRTITEHALRNERWDDTVPPGGWVCAICGTPCESEPCPHHGHAVAPWCCDTCKTFLEAKCGDACSGRGGTGHG